MSFKDTRSKSHFSKLHHFMYMLILLFIATFFHAIILYELYFRGKISKFSIDFQRAFDLKLLDVWFVAEEKGHPVIVNEPRDNIDGTETESFLKEPDHEIAHIDQTRAEDDKSYEAALSSFVLKAAKEERLLDYIKGAFDMAISVDSKGVIRGVQVEPLEKKRGARRQKNVLVWMLLKLKRLPPPGKYHSRHGTFHIRIFL